MQKKSTSHNYYNREINVGIIGCGKVAHFHADVLKAIGLNIVAACGRRKDERLAAFQHKYGVARTYDIYIEMVESESLDCIWITASWDSIFNIVWGLAEKKIPLFVEKPLALSRLEIEKLNATYPFLGEIVQIGHNRRFYDFIPMMQSMIGYETIETVEIQIPENAKGIQDPRLLQNLFIKNSSHMIDLAYFLLGRSAWDIIYVSDCPSGGYDAFIKGPHGVPIHLVAKWNTPSNFALRLHFSDKLMELKPIEKLAMYEGFRIIDPTPEHPIREYQPAKVFEYNISPESLKFKPGFLNQAKNFVETCVLKNYDNVIASNIDESYDVVGICEEIMSFNA